MAPTDTVFNHDPIFVRWANKLNVDIDTLDKRTGRVEQVAADSVATSTATAPPTDAGSFSCSESGYTIDGVLYSEVTVSYKAPTPLGNFAGVYLVLSGYRSSTELVKVAEHSFSGVAGGSANFRVTLQRTGETVTAYLVAKNSLGGSKDDWASSPTTTVTLDGNASAPNAPVGVTSTPSQLGCVITWTANAELNLSGYKVYRGTTNVFGSATLLNSTATNRNGPTNYTDTAMGLATLYYYFVTAVNTAGLESAASSSVTGYSGVAGVVNYVVDGTFGSATTTTSVTIYWDGTNGGTTFTLRLPDNTTKSIPTNSVAVTGLTLNTAYRFYPYYDIASDAVVFVSGLSGMVGTPTYALPSATATTAQLTGAAQASQFAGRVALSPGGYIVSTTPAVGTGGGGAGGGSTDPRCVAEWALIETKHGLVPARDINPGDLVKGLKGFSEVRLAKKGSSEVQATIQAANGLTLVCTPDHVLALPKGRWARAESCGGTPVLTERGLSKVAVEFSYRHMPTVELTLLGDDPTFYANGILCHNAMVK